jgi:hypothetical protein
MVRYPLQYQLLLLPVSSADPQAEPLYDNWGLLTFLGQIFMVFYET